jgi:hypothetical protein
MVQDARQQIGAERPRGGCPGRARRFRPRWCRRGRPAKRTAAAPASRLGLACVHHAATSAAADVGQRHQPHAHCEADREGDSSDKSNHGTPPLEKKARMRSGDVSTPLPSRRSNAGNRTRRATWCRTVGSSRPFFGERRLVGNVEFWSSSGFADTPPPRQGRVPWHDEAEEARRGGRLLNLDQMVFEIVKEYGIRNRRYIEWADEEPRAAVVLDAPERLDDSDAGADSD